MKLRYSARARAQLLSIEEYIRIEGNPDAAANVGRRIRDSGEMLRHFPRAGRPGKVAGTREWVVWQLPYVIVYEFDAGELGELTVLGIFHCRQSRS